MNAATGSRQPTATTPLPRIAAHWFGVYCVAKTSDGDYLTDVMGIDEVYAIRDRSGPGRTGAKARGPRTQRWSEDHHQARQKLWPHKAHGSRQFTCSAPMPERALWMSSASNQSSQIRHSTLWPAGTGRASPDPRRAGRHIRHPWGTGLQGQGRRWLAHLKAACKERARDIDSITDVEPRSQPMSGTHLSRIVTWSADDGAAHQVRGSPVAGAKDLRPRACQARSLQGRV